MIISQRVCVWRALVSTLYSFSPVNLSKICLNSPKILLEPTEMLCCDSMFVQGERSTSCVLRSRPFCVLRQSLRVGLCSLLISLWLLAGEPTGLSAYLHFPTTPVFQTPVSWCTLCSLLIELSPPPMNPICSRFN